MHTFIEHICILKNLFAIILWKYYPDYVMVPGNFITGNAFLIYAKPMVHVIFTICAWNYSLVSRAILSGSSYLSDNV